MTDRNKNADRSQSQTRDLRQKYRNYAQLCQGVSQVNEPRLTASERLFLMALAAFSVKTEPHPGNEKLARACGVASRQAVNAIARRLLAKQLIEIVTVGNGRGKATVYRICTEDDRFPSPKPATQELPLSEDKPANAELRVSRQENPQRPNEKPATNETKTRNGEPENPQMATEKPATLAFRTDLRTDTRTDRSSDTNPGEPPSLLTELVQRRQLLFAALIRSGRVISSLFTQECYREFKTECIARGVPWRVAEQAWQEQIVRKFQEPAPVLSPAPKAATLQRGEAPRHVLVRLRSAGERGLATAELARSVLGELTYKNKDKIVGIVANLRRAGHVILTVGDQHNRRFVLKKKN